MDNLNSLKYVEFDGNKCIDKEFESVDDTALSVTDDLKPALHTCFDNYEKCKKDIECSWEILGHPDAYVKLIARNKDQIEDTKRELLAKLLNASNNLDNFIKETNQKQISFSNSIDNLVSQINTGNAKFDNVKEEVSQLTDKNEKISARLEVGENRIKTLVASTNQLNENFKTVSSDNSKLKDFVLKLEAQSYNFRLGLVIFGICACCFVAILIGLAIFSRKVTATRQAPKEEELGIIGN
jgi:chromosome segregation ATPase